MIWQWYAFFITLALFLASAYWALNDNSDVSVVVAIFVGVAAFVFLLIAGIISGERHWGRIACHSFSAQTHRQTKFVIYTSWDGGDCLTPDGSGHWIPTKNLREFGSTA